MLRRKQPILYWQMADDEEMWQQLTAHDVPTATAHGESRPGKILSRRLWAAVALTLVLIALLGGYLYRQAAAGLALVTSELETTVETETWAAANGSQAALKQVLDPAAPAGWRARIIGEQVQSIQTDAGPPPLAAVRPLQFQDGVALVAVHERGATGQIYVVHRFYREMEDGWVRTPPRPALWGPQRYHETDYFQFHFRQRDAAAVRAVAAEIDETYSGLRRDLGLPQPPGAGRLSVHVTVPEAPQLAMLRVQFVQGSLNVPSPHLIPLLARATPAEALDQTVRQALVQQLFQERQELWATETDPVRRWVWYLLDEGIRTWYLQQASNRPAGHAESLRWLYSAWPDIRRSDQALGADEAKRLCHLTTGGPPVVANWLLPAECSAADLAELRLKLPAPPQTLNDLELASDIPAVEEHWIRRWQRRAVLASVVGYGVEVYGRESVPRLLQAMAEHDDWETLIPAVYGVSAEEFQAGWLAYLTM